MSDRSVRFQQFLQFQPQTVCMEDPVPLFSPTLVPASQNVLHNIFSPNATKFSSRARVFKEPVIVTAKPTLQTPGKNKYTNAARKTSPRTPEAQKENDSPVKQGELFFSPAHTATSSQFTPFSGISRITHTTKTSAHALPAIEMLSLEYIRNSNSIKQLQKIVMFLKEQQKYPSLLRAAEQRLTVVQQQQQHLVPPTSSHYDTMPPPSPKSMPDDSQEQQNESSLVMSLSSDDDSDLEMSTSGNGMVSDLEMSTSGNGMVAAPMPPPPPPTRARPGRIPPVVNQGSKHDDEHLEEELCNEVQQLTTKILELESGRVAEQNELWQKLQELETAKLRAEENMEALNGEIARSNKDTKERIHAMDVMRQENLRLQMALERERKTREDKNREALELERQLKAKVEELTRKLSQIEQPSNEDASVGQKNKELNTLLRSAQRNLEDIKKERDAMLQGLLNATGRGVSHVKPLSKKDRSQLVAEIAKEVASSKAALDAMAKTLVECESDRNEAIQAQQRTEAHLRATVKSSRRLERDNLQLTRQLQHLSDELTASRAHADELMSSERDKQQNTWGKQQTAYKQVIRGLKEQLRTDEAMVSMKLYKSAVEEVKTKARECETHQKIVWNLNSKVAKLEQQLQGCQTSSVKENSSNLNSKVAKLEQQLQGCQTSSVKENSSTPIRPSTKRVVARKRASKEETTDNTAFLKTTEMQRRNAAFTFGAPVVDKNEGGRSRITMVRAAGGRKGLQKKLSKLRSPRAEMAVL